MCSSLKITQVCTTAASNTATRRRINTVNRSQAASALALENASSNQDLASVHFNARASLPNNLWTPSMPVDKFERLKDGFGSGINEDINLPKKSKSTYSFNRISIEDRFRK